MQFFWKFVDELVGKGIEWYVLAKVMLFAATTFVPMALPIGILLSSLITFGNMGERYELVALKASGISLLRLFTPLIVFVLAITCLSVYFSNNVLPKTNLKFQSVFYDIRHQKLAFNLVEGVYYDGIDGYVIRVNKKDDDGRTLHGIMIYSHPNNTPNNEVTIAEWGKMDIDDETSTLILTLYNGYNYDDSYGNSKKFQRPFKRIEFDQEVIRFDLSQFNLQKSDESIYKTNYKNLNRQDLQANIEHVDSVLKSKVEVYDSLSTAKFELIKSNASVDNCPDTARCDYLKRPILSHFEKEKHDEIVSEALNYATRDQTLASSKYSTLDYNSQLLRKYEAEQQSRYAIAVACFVLFLVGAPLGAIIRKGGLGLPLVLAVGIFIMYYIIFTSGQKSVIEGSLNPIFGLWLANIITFPIGLFLTIKANSDSPVMDLDYWNKIVLKIKAFLKSLSWKHADK